MPDSSHLAGYKEAMRRLHDSYHAAPDMDIHPSPGGNGIFVDAQPGTAEFARAHLVGSAAPEPYMERFDGIGPEDFGPVELIDGRTGKTISKVNRHMRKRLEDR